MYFQAQTIDTVSTAAQKVGEATVPMGDKLYDGFIISILGYGIVFLALLTLYFVFFRLAKILTNRTKKKLHAEGKETQAVKEIDISGEVNAAISTALYLHFQEAHDLENTILTIKKVQRPYSPWSSKLYGLRQYPKK